MEDRSIKQDAERMWRVWPFAATLAVVIGIALVNDTLSSIRGGDAASYMLLAKSIATGHGLADINIPGAPPHTQYPPVLPLILAPLYALFGYNFVVMRILLLVFSYGAVYMAGRYFDRLAGGRVATAVAFLTATNFFYLFFAREFMTEVPYALFALLALYFTRKFGERGGVREYVIILPALVALTYMTRMIGVTLYAAVMVSLFISYIEGRAEPEQKDRARRRLLYFGVAAIVPFVMWSVRNSLFAGDVATYQSIFLQGDYYSLDAGGAGVASIAARFAQNVGYYFDAIPSSIITSAGLKGVLGPVLLSVLSTAVLLLVILGLVRELRVRRGVKDIYFIIYFGLLTVWPVYGSGDARRYVVPMIPFVYYYLIVGISALSGLRSAFAGNAMRYATAAVIASLALLAVNLYDIREIVWPPSLAGRLAGGGRTIKANLLKKIDVLTPEAASAKYFEGFAPCYANYIYASEYLGRVMSPEGVVMTRKPEIAYLVSGRYAVRFPYTSDRSTMEAFVEKAGVTHVMFDACYPEAGTYVKPYIEAHADEYATVADDTRGTVILRRIKKGGGEEESASGGREGDGSGGAKRDSDL